MLPLPGEHPAQHCSKCTLLSLRLSFITYLVNSEELLITHIVPEVAQERCEGKFCDQVAVSGGLYLPDCSVMDGFVHVPE